MKKDTDHAALIEAVMSEVDDRIRIIKTKDIRKNKIVVQEATDEVPVQKQPLPKEPISQPTRRPLPLPPASIEPESSKPKILTPYVSTDRKSTYDPKSSSIDIPLEKSASKGFFKSTVNYSVQVDDEGNEVYLMFYKREEGPYTEEEIVAFLKEHGIVFGIDYQILKEIAAGNCYYEELLVAQGIPAIEGTNGYFEFHFDTNPETKPIVFQDGSVDYNTLGKMELVEIGQLLVTYHPSTKSFAGKDVFGNIITVPSSVDLPPLKGNGFELDKEHFLYHSTIEGNVTYKNNTLKVTPVFVVNENLEATTGNVDFHGDVLVKGNVYSNVTIKTTGSITINGHVEVATLIAGKDILLKNGMQGSGLGRILAKGNLMAKFLEQTSVKINGNLSTNALLNCDIDAGGSITISGTRGAIIGGSATAVEQITAFSIGNRVGIRTKIVIGLEEEFKIAMEKTEEELATCRENLKDIEHQLSRILFQLKSSTSQILTNDRTKYMREKILNQSRLNELLIKKDSLILVRERSAEGSIVVPGITNIGTTIIINGTTEQVQSEYKNVTFSKKRNEIQVKSNTVNDNTMRTTKKHKKL